MPEFKAIEVEFTIRELQIIVRALSSCNPPREDEIILTMLHARLQRKIEEKLNS